MRPNPCSAVTNNCALSAAQAGTDNATTRDKAIAHFTAALATARLTYALTDTNTVRPRPDLPRQISGLDLTGR
ncbi:hypothetical protein GCM10011321_05650 [Youhaiella tibetensis]|nr:hypothetical protein GCM10011321_05650 [Youhaiella tibetensis]